MSRRRAFLAVEGPTDEAVVVRALIRLLGFKRFGGTAAELDGAWRSLVPTYPEVRQALWTAAHAVDPRQRHRLGRRLRRRREQPDPERRGALREPRPQRDARCLRVVVDADDKLPDAVAARYQAGFLGLFPAFPKRPGEVVVGPPALGVFVLPDNAQQGVVEHLVIECGGHAYPAHVERARRYVDEFIAGDPASARKWDPFDEQKAVIASVASLLRPGKTNAVTIEDNRWISDETKHLPMLAELLRFLRALIPGEPASG